MKSVKSAKEDNEATAVPQPDYMEDVKSLLKDDENVLAELVHRFTSWFKQNKNKMHGFIEQLHPEGLSYPMFMDAMRDLAAPFNTLELQAIYHGLLAEGGVTVIDNPEGRLVQIKQMEEAPLRSYISYCYEEALGQACKSGMSIEDMVKAIHTKLGTISEARASQYVTAHFIYEPYELKRNYPYHFDAVISLDTSLNEIRKIIVDHMNYSALIRNISVKIRELNVSTPSAMTLRDLGVMGGAIFDPPAITVHYKDHIGYIDCPMLVSELYPYRTIFTTQREDKVIQSSAAVEVYAPIEENPPVPSETNVPTDLLRGLSHQSSFASE